MKRFVVLCAAVALGVTAGPASAFNTGAPPGPPNISGGPGATVQHCNALPGGSGVFVQNKHGVANNTCEFDGGF